MTFSRATAVQVQRCGLDPLTMRRVLSRVEGCAPHLRFTQWQAKKTSEAKPNAKVFRCGRRQASLALEIEVPHVRLDVVAQQQHGRVSTDEVRFLQLIADEAIRTIQASRYAPLSLTEFGSSAVAEEIRRRGKLELDPLPVLQFIRSLRQATYENQRLSYGVILSRRPGGGSAKFYNAFDNKRFKRITDGFSTALVLDRYGGIIGLTALAAPVTEGVAARRRAWWSANLAATAVEKDGIGVALTQNGDLIVVSSGRIIFTQRAGLWRMWNHIAISHRIKSLWDFSGASGHPTSVLSYLYQVALDLSFERSGGLLLLLGNQRELRKVLSSNNDRINAARRTGPERALDRSLSKRLVQNTDRRIIVDIASLDGALVVDRRGRLLAYGAMLNPSRSAKQGARTRAAIAASYRGVAIKVSTDGDIQLYRHGKLALEV